MKCLEDSEFRLIPFAEMPEQSPHSQLMLTGQSVGAQVPGVVCEACIKLDLGYVLLTTDDIPNEEVLHVTLLNEQGVLIESLQIGGMYATGSFRNLLLLPPNQLQFNFIGGTPWTIEVLGKPGRHWPLISDPRGVKRGFRRRRFFETRLTVSADPQPET